MESYYVLQTTITYKWKFPDAISLDRMSNSSHITGNLIVLMGKSKIDTKYLEYKCNFILLIDIVE